MRLTLRLLAGELAILRLAAAAAVPDWASSSPGPLVSITRTGQELSILCARLAVPAEVPCEAEWRAITVVDTLPFLAVGVLASILEPLAAAGISILSISTFDTDYVLVRASALNQAMAVLRQTFSFIE